MQKKHILIRECHKCKPKKWEALRESYATYVCKSCHRVVKKVLREIKHAG